MLSRGSTYALRALTFMATAGPEDWHLNRTIAAELDLPAQFLTKVLRALIGEGILESQRGKKGGFRLARPANRISLLDVVEPFDHLASGNTCVLGQAACSDEHACPLHERWQEISQSLKQLLGQTTLEQLAAGAGSDGFPKPLPKSIFQSAQDATRDKSQGSAKV